MSKFYDIDLHFGIRYENTLSSLLTEQSNKKVTDQYRRYIVPYSDKGYASDSRWKISTFNTISDYWLIYDIGKIMYIGKIPII